MSTFLPYAVSKDLGLQSSARTDWANAPEVRKYLHDSQAATSQLLARFLPLADGTGDTHVSCLHLEQGATVPAPSTTHAA